MYDSTHTFLRFILPVIGGLAVEPRVHEALALAGALPLLLAWVNSGSRSGLGCPTS